MNLSTILSEINTIKKVIVSDTIVELRYKDVDDDVVLELSKKYDCTMFKPCGSLPYYWCQLEDDNVEVTIRGKEKSFKLI